MFITAQDLKDYFSNHNARVKAEKEADLKVRERMEKDMLNAK